MLKETGGLLEASQTKKRLGSSLKEDVQKWISADQRGEAERARGTEQPARRLSFVHN